MDTLLIQTLSMASQCPYKQSLTVVLLFILSISHHCMQFLYFVEVLKLVNTVETLVMGTFTRWTTWKRLTLIARVNVVLNRTVVDSD